MKIRPPNPALKHGMYASIKPRKVDKRTWLWKQMNELHEDLVADLGGEENLTAQTKILLEDLIIPQVISIRSFIQKCMEPDYDPAEGSLKFWVSLSNSLRLNLCAIGLERRAKDITPLSERLASLASKSAKEEGSDGQG